MQTLYKILLTLSPVAAAAIFGYLSKYTSDDPGNMVIGIALAVTVVLGIPFVAITGLIISFMVRKQPNAPVLSTYGYLFPAFLTWLFASTILFN